MKIDASFLKIPSIQLVGGLSVFAVFLSVFSCWLGDKEAFFFNSAQVLKKKLTERQDLVASLQIIQKLTQDNQKIYEQFLVSRFTEPLRKMELRKTITTLAQGCGIQNFHLKFNSLERSEPFVTEHVTLTGEALWDKDFFVFLARLSQSCPGFVNITSYSLTRTTTLSQDILQKISKGEPQTLFRGKVDLAWVHLPHKERQENS